MTIALILVEIFTVIMQRNVCEKAFDRKPAGIAVQFMVWAADFNDFLHCPLLQTFDILVFLSSLHVPGFYTPIAEA